MAGAAFLFTTLAKEANENRTAINTNEIPSSAL